MAFDPQLIPGLPPQPQLPQWGRTVGVILQEVRPGTGPPLPTATGQQGPGCKFLISAGSVSQKPYSSQSGLSVLGLPPPTRPHSKGKTSTPMLGRLASLGPITLPQLVCKWEFHTRRDSGKNRGFRPHKPSSEQVTLQEKSTAHPAGQWGRGCAVGKGRA